LVLYARHEVSIMISVSAISEFIYCPFKVYLRYVEGYQIQSPFMLVGRLYHEVNRGYEELIKRNIWSLNKKMNLEEVSLNIFEGVSEFVAETSQKYENPELMDNEKFEDVKNMLESQLKLDSLIIAIKTKKILNTGKSPLEIVDMLFPPSILDLTLENSEIGLKGKVDKVELGEGIYYPVEIKTGFPPVKGVWQADALQITAYSLLIEEELKKEVLVGFVDYLQIRERKTVVVNSNLREKLVETLSQLQSLIYEGDFPDKEPVTSKCNSCNYAPVCDHRPF